jgi:hypothetical protein
MIAEPAETPVTAPVEEPTVATAVLLLLHVPPPVLWLRVVTEPWHTLVVPVIGGSDSEETVTVPPILFAHPVVTFVATT